MHDAEPDDLPDGFDAELLMRLSAGWLLTMPSVDHYLCHLAEQGAVLFAEAISDDPAEVAAAPASKVLRADAPQFFRSLGWNIARSMPLPALGWKPHRLQPPGRNEPCLCGSGAKYKHCCQRLIEHGPRLDPSYLGALVLQAMPARQWKDLPASAVHPDMVTAAAHDLSERGAARDALRLLEPWARMPAPWSAQRVELLDLLADLYLDLGHPRKRKTLAQAMIERGDTAVQSLGWQRLSMMASDQGDAAGARAAFERAQRLTPDDPRIALLEVTSLLGTGEVDRAHERAAFHARRLARLPHADEMATQIEGLQALARGEMDEIANAAFGGGDAGDSDGDDGDDGEDDEGVGRAELAQMLAQAMTELQSWVQAQPPARLRLDLGAATPLDLGELKPDPALARQLARWRKTFAPPAAAGEMQTVDPGRWQALLRRQPQLLDSFEVLDDLVAALHLAPPVFVAGVLSVLLLRAIDLWTLLHERFPQARCEWGWMGNRPALRLLVQVIELDTTPRAERSFEWLRAIVDVLNPDDRHGLRERLAAVLLRRGDAAGALALADRFGDDLLAMALLRTRALLALQRLPEAQAAYAAACGANRHLAALLAKARVPRPPDADAFIAGSPAQARDAVAAQHDLWRDKAVQEWLRRQSGGTPGDSPQLTLT